MVVEDRDSMAQAKVTKLAIKVRQAREKIEAMKRGKTR